MRILLCHNRYLLPGGEDRAFQRERELLDRLGKEAGRVPAPEVPG